MTIPTAPFPAPGRLHPVSSKRYSPMLLILILVSAFSPAGVTAREPAPPKLRTAPAYLAGAELRTATLYSDVLPAVVTIITSHSLTGKGDGLQQRALGSGVLISPECHVLTAAHVVEGADEIMVKTLDGKMRTAQMLFSEPSADIALVRLVEPAPELPHAKLGDSDRLAVGQLAFAVGSPYGLEHSFSVGIISGFRDFDNLYEGAIKAEFIQTDAAINSGNSGGPIFNSQGEVIGIASRILTTSGGFQGLGFVVAINTAKELLALEDRVWLGIESIYLTRQTLTDLFHHDLNGGLLIQRVSKGSPADKAGIQGGSIPGQLMGRDFLLGGDLVIHIGPQESCDVECLTSAHKVLSGLDRIPVKFLRGGKVMETVIDVSDSRRNFLKEEGGP